MHGLNLKKIMILLLLIATSYSSFASEIYIYEDKNRTLSLEKAKELFFAGKFNPLPLGDYNAGFTKSYFWLAIKPSGSVTDQNLIVGNAHINRLEFYLADQNGMRLKYLTGDHYPFKKRPISHRLFVFPLQAGIKGLYLVKVDKSNESLQLKVEILNNEHFLQRTSRESLITGMLWGITVLLILFGSFLFITVKEKLYLYYVLYILSGTLWILADKGFGYQFLWPDSPGFASLARPVSNCIAMIMLLQFMQVFIGQTKTSIFYTPILIVKILIGLTSIAFLIDPESLYQYSIFFLGLVIFLGIITQVLVALSLLEKIRQNNIQAWYYLISIFMLIVFSITELLIHSGNSVPEINYLSNYGIQTGLIIEALILTFGLAHRFNTYKNEKEHLLLEVNRKQNEITERIIETQELERKKIADQLHDDIGSLLSVVSIQLSSALENKHKSDSLIKLRKAAEVLESVSETVRSISHTLNPLAIEKYGFKNAIIDLFNNINLADRLQIEYIIIGFEGHKNIDMNLINDLYRIIKELVNNVIKHSEASHCLMQVIEHEDIISIMVEDNGIGISDKNKMKNGIGIENIRAKINYFEGQIEYSDMPDGGLLINIEIPLKTY